MKRLILLMVVLVSPLGCKKLTDTSVGKDENPQVIPGGKGNLTVGGGGGGGGIQAPRKAAARVANTVQIDQLYKIIFTAIQLDPDEKIPDANQIMQEIRKDGKLVAMIHDEILILTNSTHPQGIIGYTKWPQQNGNHFVMTKSGVGPMAPAELMQALQAQGTMAKLEK